MSAQDDSFTTKKAAKAEYLSKPPGGVDYAVVHAGYWEMFALWLRHFAKNLRRDGTIYTCCYCGHQFDPRDPELKLSYTDINNRKGLDETVLRPMCGIDEEVPPQKVTGSNVKVG